MRRKIRKVILLSILLAAGGVVLFAAAVYAGVFGPLPGQDDWEQMENATASLVLSTDGETIGKYFLENRTNVEYDQLPGHLIHALIATEDHRFYRHGGLDTRSVFRVIIKSVILRDSHAGGGSTLTQQLAKNLFGRERHGVLTLPVNKVREVIIARRMEKVFSKQEILVLYLNSVPFGENVYGVEAAAERFFSKSAVDLNVQESAILVGMLKANTAYNPRLYPQRARSRRNVVIDQMKRHGHLQQAEADSLQGLPLGLLYSFSFADKAQTGYFLQMVKQETNSILTGVYEQTGVKYDPETDGLLIGTTLDLALQQSALEALRTHMQVMQGRLNAQYLTTAGRRQFHRMVEKELAQTGLSERANEVRWQHMFHWDSIRGDSVTVRDSLHHALGLLHAGILGMDPATGAIITYIGGIDHATQPWDQIKARRQLASAFKPILYAAALEKGIKPCRYLDNDSLVIAGYEGYSPQNHDGSYGGMYSMTGALAHSMNVPTFHLFLKTGFAPLNHLWKEMGFSYPLKNTPSLALGTAEASIIELAVAYAAFANGGYRVEQYTVETISDQNGNIIYERKKPHQENRVMAQETSQIINVMLQQAVENGTANAVRSRFGIHLPLAAKTGTSQNYADAWFAAYNPNLLIISRVGGSSPAVHFNTAGNGGASALALPLVAMTMKQIQSDTEKYHRLRKPFPPLPQHLSEALDCPHKTEKKWINRLIHRLRSNIISFEEEEQHEHQQEQQEEQEEKPGFLTRLFRRL